MTGSTTGTMQAVDGPAQIAMLTAVAEPNRFRIVELLRDSALTVGEAAAQGLVLTP